MKKPVLITTLLTMLINLQLNSQITPSTFESRVDRSTGSSPFSMDMADLDGDNRRDMAVVNNSGNTISVYLNTASLGNLGLCSFDNKVDFTTGGSPRTVRIGDIDGDTKPDLVVANSSANSFSVLKNTCSLGNISFAVKVDFNTGNFPASLSLGDVNGDGKLDVIVAEYNDDAFSVFINTSSGSTVSFGSPVTFATSSSPQDVIIGELNAVGKPEIVISNINSDIVSVYENLYVSGSFGPASLASAITCATNDQPDWLKLGDIDGDGKDDIIVSELNNTSPGFSVIRNTLSGGVLSFASNVHIATGSYPIGVSVADIDGDIDPDVAIAVTSANNISVFENTTSGTSISFATSVNFGCGSGSVPQDVFLSDVDGDSKPDISTVNYGNATISQFRNTIATSSFAEYVNFTANASPFSIDAGDLNGDGFNEIVVANYSNNDLSVFKNTSTAGNITHCSFATKVDFATGSNPRTVKLADIDGDGLADMLSANEGTDDFSVFMNTGSLTFATRVDINTFNHPSALAVGDLNNDNQPDVAVSEYMNKSFSIYINTSSPGGISFASPVTFYLSGHPQFIGISELNGTGSPEVVVSIIDLDEVQVFENLYTGGTFNTGSLNLPHTLNTLDQPDWLALKDIDGDGENDIAVTNLNNTSPGFSTFRNIHIGPTLAFSSRQDFTTGNYPIGIQVEDIDGDGLNDIAVAVTIPEVISVFPSNGSSGTISFATKVDFSCASGDVPQDLIFANLDGTGTGKPDMAVANNGSSSMSVYRNKSVTGTISLKDALMTSIDPNKIQFMNDVIVYPNPADHDLNLSFYLGENSSAYVDLFDINGKNVYHFSLKQTGENQQQDLHLKTGYLPSGIYLLRLNTGNKQTTRKIVFNR